MKLSIVIPVYNEAEVIEETIARIFEVLQPYRQEFEVIFCLDPSTDETLDKLRQGHLKDSRIKIIHFSRRFGQPAATIAGLNYASGEFTCVLDADLQDPPELIPTMLQICESGTDIVVATRTRRSGEKASRKILANIAYRVIDKISEIEIPRNTGDFRMFSRRALDSLLGTSDQDAFLRGMTAYIGFNQKQIFFDRPARKSGESKYNSYTGSLRIALNGLIGYSRKPLTYLAIFGAFVSICCFMLGIYFAVAKILYENFTPGLSTTGILVTFLSGLQMFSIGLLGEYIGRIHLQVRNKPLYIIQETIGFGAKE